MDMNVPVNSKSGGNLILGLDIGVASLGWALVREGSGRSPGSVVALGSHLFEAGTEGSDAERQRGADQPRNQVRRTARLTRRQIWRRARRKRALLQELVECKLLPKPEDRLRTPAEIDAYLKGIDKRIRLKRDSNDQPKWTAGHLGQQRWPYLIRRAAVVGTVERHEFGRALYHLAQRRGFLSNRKADAGTDEDERSAMKEAIGALADRIKAHDPPTLGAVLAGMDPDEERIRCRWTARQMFLDEFEAMWSAQREALELTDDAHDIIHERIFHQRPLKSQNHLIGSCSLIPEHRRAPLAHRLTQRWRLLQTVNNLELNLPGEAVRRLTADERAAIVEALCIEGDLTWAKARKAAGIRTRGARFGLEDQGEKKLIGHRTDAKLRSIFGDRFEAFSDLERDQIVEDLRSFRDPDALTRRGEKHWKLSKQDAQRLADTQLEEGYANICLEAMQRLLPMLEDGVHYATARRELFPDSFTASEAWDLLPPVVDFDEDLRNPGVARALTEIRKVVNEVVRTHGKPDRIHIELARSIKNPPKVRERMNRQNRDRQKTREAIKGRIMKELGYASPSRADIEKVLLADECSWRCPYTNEQINWDSLLGRTPQFDIEHIWPKSRSLDDSYLNKTLCFHEENRARKKGRTPFEAYGSDEEQWEAVLDRVRGFTGDVYARREKLRRFEATEIDEGFTNRHLSDTRHIGKLAADYLGLLYGGRDDAMGNKRVFVRTGGLTAWLRTGWGLADILGSKEDGSKSRDDNRHHAIDAVVVALSSERAVQTLVRAAEDAERRGVARAFESIEPPWPGFLQEVSEKIASVLVSHRQSRRVSGALHNATLYSKAMGDGRHRVSKELEKLSPTEVAAGKIVDRRALAAIREKLESAGLSKPTPQQMTKFFSDPGNAPLVQGHGGKMVRLRRVRVEVGGGKTRIGKGASERLVDTASNHHTVIWGVLSADLGNGKPREIIRWEHEPVTLLEVYRRIGAKEPMVNRDGGRDRVFIFSLAKGEHIEIDDPSGKGGPREVYRVLAFSEGEIKVIRTWDARQSAVSGKDRVRPGPEKLRKLNARKVRVTHLGELRPAGD